MALYQDETAGLSTRDRTVQPPDLLARSGLPVPTWVNEAMHPQFNNDMRRLVARISSLFALIAPTAQGAPTAPDALNIVAHAPQHQNGGGDEVSILNLAATGLVPGDVMRAITPSTYAFGPLEVSNLPPETTFRSLVYELRATELVVGKKAGWRVPFDAVITRWTLLADVADTASIDIFRSSVAVFPTSASIAAAGNEPSIAAQAAASQAPVGWGDVNVTEGDIIGYEVLVAPALATLVTLSLDLLLV